MGTQCSRLLCILLVLSFYVRAVGDYGSFWVQEAKPGPCTKRFGHQSLVFKNKIWIIGGNGSLDKTNEVSFSEDSHSWSTVAGSMPWAKRSDHASVVFKDKMWILGGNGSILGDHPQGPFSDVWCSSDGENWTSVTLSAPWGPRLDHTAVVFDGKIWIMGGLGAGGVFGNLKNDVWYSEDGAEWKLATTAAPWSPRDGAASVVFDNKMWLFGGHDMALNASLRNDAWFSTNGTSWTLAESYAGWEPRYFHTATVHDGRIWIIGGFGMGSNEEFADVWYSSDGLGWSRAASNTIMEHIAQHTCVSFDDKLWVLGGAGNRSIYDNSIYYSDKAYNLEETNKIPVPCTALAVSGSVLYLGDESGGSHGLSTYDASDWDHPVLKAAAPLPEAARDIVTTGGYSYVAVGKEGVRIFQADALGALLPVAGYPSQDETNGISLSNNLLCMADGSAGLAVVDVSDPSSPTLRSRFPVPEGYTAPDVAVSGVSAYLCYYGPEFGSGRGIELLDLADPEHPRRICSNGIRCFPERVLVYGREVYVAAAGDQADDLSLLDPESLRYHYQIGSFGDAWDVASLDGLAYVSSIYPSYGVTSMLPNRNILQVFLTARRYGIPLCGYMEIENDSCREPRILAAADRILYANDKGLHILRYTGPRPVIYGVSDGSKGVFRLSAGVSIYTDRGYTLSEPIPAFLRDQEFIPLPNDDKSTTKSNYLEFDISRDATIYLAYDGRVSPPEWLKGWRQTGFNLMTTDGSPDRILYCRFFPKGTVTLGGNSRRGQSNECSMYFPIAVPSDAPEARASGWEEYQ